MSHRHFYSAIAFAVALLSLPAAWAQDKPTATSLAPAGQGPGVNASSPATSGRSTVNRAGVKSTTQSQGRARTLQPAGEAANPAGADPATAGKALAPRGSTTSRDAVKAETRAAASSRSLQPAGQAPQPAGEAPKK